MIIHILYIFLFIHTDFVAFESRFFCVSDYDTVELVFFNDEQQIDCHIAWENFVRHCVTDKKKTQVACPFKLHFSMKSVKLVLQNHVFEFNSCVLLQCIFKTMR